MSQSKTNRGKRKKPTEDEQEGFPSYRLTPADSEDMKIDTEKPFPVDLSGVRAVGGTLSGYYSLNESIDAWESTRSILESAISENPSLSNIITIDWLDVIEKDLRTKRQSLVTEKESDFDVYEEAINDYEELINDPSNPRMDRPLKAEKDNQIR